MRSSTTFRCARRLPTASSGSCRDARASWDPGGMPSAIACTNGSASVPWRTWKSSSTSTTGCSRYERYLSSRVSARRAASGRRDDRLVRTPFPTGSLTSSAPRSRRAAATGDGRRHRAAPMRTGGRPARSTPRARWSSRSPPVRRAAQPGASWDSRRRRTTRKRGTSPSALGGGDRRASTRCAPPSSTDTAGPSVAASKSRGVSATADSTSQSILAALRMRQGREPPSSAVGEHHPHPGRARPSNVHKPLANGPERRLGAGAEAELGEDVRHVCPGGSLAYVKLRGDLLVGLAHAHEPEHLELTCG